MISRVGVVGSGAGYDIIIRSRKAELEIDQYPVFASLGYMSSHDLLIEASQRAYQNCMRFIEKTASDGDRLAAIEHGGEPLADIAERDAFPGSEIGLNGGPGEGPKFDVKYITKMYRMNGTLVGTKVDRYF